MFKSNLEIFRINELSKTNFSLRQQKINMPKKPQSYNINSKTYKKWAKKQMFGLYRKAKIAKMTQEQKIKEQIKQQLIQKLSNDILTNHKIFKKRRPIRRRPYFSENEINNSHFFSMKNISY